MRVTVTSLPPSEKNPSDPFLYPADVSTCSAAVALPAAATVSAAAGAAQAEKVGRVMPLVLVTGFSRPASPSLASTVRLTARLIALRTASWFVGHLFRFG